MMLKTHGYRPITVLLLSVLLSSCAFISGQGPITDREIDLDPFTSIDVHGSFEVELNQGTAQKVVAHGHGNIIERLFSVF